MEKITHQGIIIAIKKNKTAEIKIISRPSCTQCPAHHHCGFGDEKEKIISVAIPENNTYKIGETVIVSLTISIGLKAVIYSYALPLILLLSTIIITHYFNFNDFISGISGIIILIPYYFGVFLANKKLKSIFSFELKHKN